MDLPVNSYKLLVGAVQRKAAVGDSNREKVTPAELTKHGKPAEKPAWPADETSTLPTFEPTLEPISTGVSVSKKRDTLGGSPNELASKRHMLLT